MKGIPVKTFDEVIRELKEKQLDKIAIYPYGKVGKQIEDLLKNEYGISDVILFDKEQSSSNVIDSRCIIDYPDYYFIVATKSRKIKKEIKNFIEELLSQGCHEVEFACFLNHDVLDFLKDNLNNVTFKNELNNCSYCYESDTSLKPTKNIVVIYNLFKDTVFPSQTISTLSKCTM